MGKSFLCEFKPQRLAIEDILVENHIRQEGNDLDLGLNDLITSIQRFGLISPILVAKRESDEGPIYKLISGLRRLRAMIKLQFKKIDCVVIAESCRLDESLISIAENYHRKDMDFMETCVLLSKISQNGIALDTIRSATGLSEESVRRMLRIGQWPADIKELVQSNEKLLKKRDLFHLASLRQDYALLLKATHKRIEENSRPCKDKKKDRYYSFLEDFCRERDLTSEDIQVLKSFVDKHLI